MLVWTLAVTLLAIAALLTLFSQPPALHARTTNSEALFEKTYTAGYTSTSASSFTVANSWTWITIDTGPDYYFNVDQISFPSTGSSSGPQPKPSIYVVETIPDPIVIPHQILSWREFTTTASTWTNSGTNHYDAPGDGFALRPNTRYYIVALGDSSDVQVSTAPNSGSSPYGITFVESVREFTDTFSFSTQDPLFTIKGTKTASPKGAPVIHQASHTMETGYYMDWNENPITSPVLSYQFVWPDPFQSGFYARLCEAEKDGEPFYHADTCLNPKNRKWGRIGWWGSWDRPEGAKWSDWDGTWDYLINAQWLPVYEKGVIAWQVKQGNNTPSVTEYYDLELGRLVTNFSPAPTTQHPRRTTLPRGSPPSPARCRQGRR